MSADARTTVRQVVRGERPWTDLQALGIQIQFEGAKCRISNPAGIDITAEIHDLAHGLLKYIDHPQELKTWAFVLEAADFVDFDGDQHPAREKLLDALWNASFGNPIDADVIQTARELVERGQSSEGGPE